MVEFREGFKSSGGLFQYVMTKLNKGLNGWCHIYQQHFYNRRLIKFTYVLTLMSGGEEDGGHQRERCSAQLLHVSGVNRWMFLTGRVKGDKTCILSLILIFIWPNCEHSVINRKRKGHMIFSSGCRYFISVSTLKNEQRRRRPTVVWPHVSCVSDRKLHLKGNCVRLPNERLS